jgi:hypothetical protein
MYTLMQGADEIALGSDDCRHKFRCSRFELLSHVYSALVRQFYTQGLDL